MYRQRFKQLGVKLIPSISNEMVMEPPSPYGESFVTTWRMPSDELELNVSLYYPADEFGEGVVDWGDGNVNDYIDQDESTLIHTYDAEGDYVVTITGRYEQFWWGYDDRLIHVHQLGNMGWVTLNSSFSGASELLTFTSGICDLSNVDTMESMLYHCDKLHTIDMSHPCVAPVDLETAFAMLPALTSIDVSGMDMSNVESISNMFWGCTALEHLDLSSWTDVSNITNFSYMVDWCPSLISVTTAPWVFAGVNDLGDPEGDLLGMFNNCTNLTDVSSIGSWDTSNVTNMHDLFASCTKLESVPIWNWDLPNVTTIIYAFHGCTSLLSVEPTNWTSLPNLTSGGLLSIFSDCTSLISAPCDNLDVSQLTSMIYMFYNCGALTTTMNPSMFWNNTNITHHTGCFTGCVNISNYADIPNDWKVL